MKKSYALLLAGACFQSALAQVVVEEVVVPTPSGEIVVEEVVTPLPPPRFDRAFARRHLLTEPREVLVPGHPPGTVVETTETERFVDVPGRPRRVYSVERNVVIVEGRELPYVTIPVLFVKETANLLDAESRMALEETAAAIHEVLKTHPDALFDIEGHTSTDGTDEFNLKLSADRARRVYQELTQRYSVPASALSAHGYGEMYPNYPDGSEEQMVLDRRVLVVRKR
jgi:outer membrane protein OmpA-like peptidoglycan-associated protein